MTSVYSPLGVCLETQVLRNSAYGQIFVCLGQLSSDSDATVAQGFEQVGQRLPDPMRRLINDRRYVLLGERAEPQFSVFCLNWWESYEQKLFSLEA